MGVLATSSAFICLTDTIWSSFSGSAGYVSSAYFNVNNVPSVVITAPSEGTVLFQGNVSTAKWIYDPNQVLSTTPVIVQLWISVDLAPDTAVSSPGSFLMSSGAAGLSFTLPPNALASSKYYWLISWGTYKPIWIFFSYCRRVPGSNYHNSSHQEFTVFHRPDHDRSMVPISACNSAGLC